MRQIFLDTETTGLSADGGDRVIEIGCVEMISRKLTGNNKHFYLNPGRESHEEALKVHGITNEFLKDKPQFPAVVDELMTYLAGAEIVIHNAAFDVGFLNKELELVGRLKFKEFVASVTDTLVMAKEMYPGKRNSLNALCERLEVDNSGRALHGALLDAELLADVYINMTRGQEALLMEVGSNEVARENVIAVDLRAFAPPFLSANEQENLAHEQVLTEIDKSSGGKTYWRVGC
ncbi:DNA polymerase III subunit epsilon [Rhodoferax sp. PAMC 29310]|uniref:DNA polymerase III subunit epsilon n=1 Tax=Rhodoferax sp. PAMC 29310 TaxID=2822760 RepID=UPI001B34363F|nr:DNA polymerase III subunit epsilon [Rhodoferax sp. PAMC 29310]